METGGQQCHVMRDVGREEQQQLDRAEVATGGQEGATRTQGVSALAGVGLIKLCSVGHGRGI